MCISNSLGSSSRAAAAAASPLSHLYVCVRCRAQAEKIPALAELNHLGQLEPRSLEDQEDPSEYCYGVPLTCVHEYTHYLSI